MATTSKGFSYILGSDSASTIDDISAALANTLELYVPFRMAAGTGSLSISNANSANVQVNFPASRFTVAPIVVCSLTGAPSGSQKITVRALNATTSKVDIYFYTGDNTNVTATGVTFAWWAVQYLTNNASG